MPPNNAPDKSLGFWEELIEMFFGAVMRGSLGIQGYVPGTV